MYYQKFESVAKISSLFYKPNYIINYFMPSDNPLCYTGPIMVNNKK